MTTPDNGTTTAVAPRLAGSVVIHPADSITDLLRIAVERGTPVAELKELVDLHERMDRRQAQRDFFAAMAAFQQECPSIKKSSTASIATKSGSKFAYTYAELDEIARTINPILARHGLSYGWDSTVEAKALTCSCTIRHANGHSERATFTLPIDSPSAMSEQQKVGAALTYAKRQSLSAALGLTTTDEDTDAADTDPTPITEDQQTVIEDLLEESKADRSKFLQYMGVVSIMQIRASQYEMAVKVLEQKKARR